MNLCVDQGNTRAKIAVFENDTLLYHAIYKVLSESDFDSLFVKFPINRCIVSTVTDVNKQLLCALETRVEKFIFLDHNTRLPIENCYQTPETLGKDRIAAIVGANYLIPDKNLLVIDAGTAVTYDFINDKGQYLGGNIAPGLTMRTQALAHFTQKLPLVDISTDKNEQVWGKNTVAAIQKGALLGMIFEINGYIDELNKKNNNNSVFLTGGDVNYFYNRLKSTTFVDIFLVLIGLNRILTYNAEI